MRDEEGVVVDRGRIDRELRALEPITHRLPPGSDRAAIGALLDDEFFEVGASGMLHTRDVVVDVVAQRYADGAEPDDDAWTIDEFTTRELGADVYLVTYRLRIAGRRSRRSTVWRRHGSGWRAAYHQGTADAPELATGTPHR